MERKFRVDKIVKTQVDRGQIGENVDETKTVQLKGDIVSITIRGPPEEVEDFIAGDTVELSFKSTQNTLCDLEEEVGIGKGIEEEFGIPAKGNRNKEPSNAIFRCDE